LPALRQVKLCHSSELLLGRHLGAVGRAAALALARVLALATIVTRLAAALAFTGILAFTGVLFLHLFVGILRAEGVALRAREKVRRLHCDSSPGQQTSQRCPCYQALLGLCHVSTILLLIWTATALKLVRRPITFGLAFWLVGTGFVPSPSHGARDCREHNPLSRSVTIGKAPQGLVPVSSRTHARTIPGFSRGLIQLAGQI